jgi:hypothetical protein
MVPLTNCVPDDAGAIVRTGIFPATALPRRVVGLGSVTAPIDVTLADGFMCSGDHLGPEEAGQLAGDRGDDDGLDVLGGDQSPEPSA